MGTTGEEAAPKPPSADEVNRLWQHGMHEERLFHDRLNYFSFLETGLLTICGIMYNKEPAIGFFLPLALFALLFTILWMVIQTRHWAYCEHVHSRIRQFVPEYRATLDGFRGGSGTGFSISKPLALAVPTLFAGTWVAFFVWLLVREPQPATADATITVERVGLVVLAAVVAWLAWRLHRVERMLREKRKCEGSGQP
jgi:hypothetical protein